MSVKRKKIDIVTASTPLKKLLRNRLFYDLDLTYGKIISNSKEDGIEGINKANLSRYFSTDNAISGTISQKSLIYLSVRYGIYIKLKVSLLDYVEEDCKKTVHLLFNE